MTLNEIELHIFAKIINKLKPTVCYVDSVDVNEKRFKNSITNATNYKTKIISKHKADEIYPIVSAASILAKTERDKKIRQIEKKLRTKLNIPLGSGYPSDPVTQKFLKNWVKEFKKLPPHTRRSWDTSKKLLTQSMSTKLNDF